MPVFADRAASEAAAQAEPQPPARMHLRLRPDPPRAAADGLSGRGLQLVEDLSAGWATAPGSHGKTVWASLR